MRQSGTEKTGTEGGGIGGAGTEKTGTEGNGIEGAGTEKTGTEGNGIEGAGTERSGYLGLGSNVGDREEHFRAALRALAEHGVAVEAVSSLYETEPVGEYLDQPDFLNAAVRIRTDLEPEGLLNVCKGIEVEQGRMFGGPRHGPRPLDLDLLLLGEIELETERLRLPHREVASRRFVLVPLLELDPDLALPDGTRLADALAALEGGGEANTGIEGGRVERIGRLD